MNSSQTNICRSMELIGNASHISSSRCQKIFWLLTHPTLSIFSLFAANDPKWSEIIECQQKSILKGKNRFYLFFCVRFEVNTGSIKVISESEVCGLWENNLRGYLSLSLIMRTTNFDEVFMRTQKSRCRDLKNKRSFERNFIRILTNKFLISKDRKLWIFSNRSPRNLSI